MPEQPRQISDLGVDASRQYALNQKELAKLPPHFLEDSNLVSSRIQVPVVSPAARSEFGAKYETRFISRWAFFPKHPQAAAGAHRLFTHRMIPSIARDFEKLLNQLDDLKAMANLDPTLLREQKAVTALVMAMVIEERIYEEIEKGRNRFQKG